MRATAELRGDVTAWLRGAGCVYAEEEARILLRAASGTASLNAMLARRCAGEPLEQVTGETTFCGVRILLDPGVFVPRHRSEHLVRCAARLVPRAGAVVVDMCCGSGALGLALLRRAGPFELHAADCDAAALRCARRNLGAGARVHRGDLFAALPSSLRGRIDVLLANVPYVPTAEVDSLPREARLHEPRTALDGGADGLDVLRRVASGAVDWLRPGGSTVVETSRGQATAAVRAFQGAGLRATVRRDERVDATVVVATRPPVAA